MIGLAQAASGRARRVADFAPFQTRDLLFAALVVGGCVHLALVPGHWPTNFAALSALAGLIQLSLAFGVWHGAGRRAYPVIAMLSLVLVQLYSLDVTMGLPPAIAHAHIAGTHTAVFGLTLSWPNTVDLDGVVAVISELIAIGCAWRLQAGGDHRRDSISPAC